MDGIQAIGGTGAIRIGLDFLKKNLKCDRVYVSDPTWGKTTNYIYVYNKVLTEHFFQFVYNSERSAISFKYFLVLDPHFKTGDGFQQHCALI